MKSNLKHTILTLFNSSKPRVLNFSLSAGGGLHLFKKTVTISCLLISTTNIPLHSQPDSVDVTFYYKPIGNPSIVYLPGEFNSWSNNSGGVINPDPRWNMTKDSTGTWYKTIRLRVGGHVGGRVVGTYQYKFNENGSANGWLSDPLNPRTNPSEYNNSILYARNPTIYQLLPLPNTVVKTDRPIISAYIYPSTTTSVDTSAVKIFIDGNIFFAGSSYNFVTKKLSFTPPSLADGEHNVRLAAGTTQGQSSSDSTKFTVQAAPIQILTRSNDDVRVGQKTIKGIVLDTTITDVRLVRNDTDTLPAIVTNGSFTASVQLIDGINVFEAIATKDSISRTSQPIRLNYKMEHTPKAIVMMSANNNTITLNPFASKDPDGNALIFRWTSEDDKNPMRLDINNAQAIFSFPRPSVPGEYYIRLEAEDIDGNRGVGRNYFTVHPDSSVTIGTTNSNPQWVRDAIVYEIFTPAFSSDGNLDAITNRIPYLKDLGVNTLWLTPIMDNLGSINEGNGGYDIIDFFNVEPKLGNLQSVKRLVDSLHANNMKLVLDITPNHVSQAHPWVSDIRQWGEYSNYRNFIETRLIGDDRGLGQYVTSYQGQLLYAHYDGWGLANLNLSDEECRLAMMDMFVFWLIDQNADGYRMDVYWGPQNRYGKQTFWRPFREEMKRVKPEMFLLGETDGTGLGSENNYADSGSASDAAYDWNLFGQIKSALNTGNVDALHQRVSNYSTTSDYNFYTGPDAHYFRFAENHDENRITQEFSFDPQRTKAAAALIMSIPGIPLLYAGQEIGWRGRRDLINFNSSETKNYFPFYRRVTRLRSMFPAFRTSKIMRVTSSLNQVYAFLRPYKDQNILPVISFTNNPGTVELQINPTDFDLTKQIDVNKTYFMNDIVYDTSYAIVGAALNKFTCTLQPFQSRIFLFSDTAFKVRIVNVEETHSSQSGGFILSQNYPNPWTNTTAIDVQIRDDGFGMMNGRMNAMSLKVFDLLGREILDLSDQLRTGLTSIRLHESMFRQSGMYFYKLEGSGFSDVKKFLLMK